MKLIIRWTDGTSKVSKQYKNVGNTGLEKYLCINHKISILRCFFPTNWGKGKIDLLGKIFHRLYVKLVVMLKERTRDLRIVVGKLNELYGTQSSTVVESMLTHRGF